MTQEMFEQLMGVRQTIIGVARSQRGDISDLATIALQEAAISLGDIIFDLQVQTMKEAA